MGKPFLFWSNLPRYLQRSYLGWAYIVIMSLGGMEPYLQAQLYWAGQTMDEWPIEPVPIGRAYEHKKVGKPKRDPAVCGSCALGLSLATKI
jgi:hypothetical protein